MAKKKKRNRAPEVEQGRLRPVTTLLPAIWWDGYNWLYTRAPTYLQYVEQSLDAGYTPDEIFYTLIRETGDDRHIATRCRHAAFYLEMPEEDRPAFDPDVE